MRKSGFHLCLLTKEPVYRLFVSKRMSRASGKKELVMIWRSCFMNI